MLLTTAHFLVGSLLKKVVCEMFQHPNDSRIVEGFDRFHLTPAVRKILTESNVRGADTMNLTFRSMIQECHRNNTIYGILQTKNLYDVEELRRWRDKFAVDRMIDSIKDRVMRADLEDVQILSPKAQKHLEDLAESQLSDLNFTKYTRLFQQQITRIDLNDFIERLREVRQKLDRSELRLVGSALENEALFLENMNSVVAEMKDAMRQLKASVSELEKEAKFNKSNFRQALRQLISEATKASGFLET